MREIREFLGLSSDRRIERDAARRQTVLMQFANGAEIRGAEKGDPVVALPIQLLVVFGFLHAKAGEADPLWQVAGNRGRRHVEIALVVDDGAGLIALDHVHLDRFAEEHAEMKKRHGKALRPIGVECVRGVELDLAPGLVIDFSDDFGRRLRRRRVRLARKLTRGLFQQLPRERLAVA